MKYKYKGQLKKGLCLMDMEFKMDMDFMKGISEPDMKDGLERKLANSDKFEGNEILFRWCFICIGNGR